MVEALSGAVADHIVESVPLKVVDRIRWRDDGQWWKAEVSVTGRGVDAALAMNLGISKRFRGKYTYHLRQVDGISIRRLDVRGTHKNRAHTGSTEVWRFQTHKHRYRDLCRDAFAYTPSDLPDTSSLPTHPEPGEHGAVYAAFCVECGIDPQDSWVDPPLGAEDTPSSE